MEGSKDDNMIQQIRNKLGFDMASYNTINEEDAHERDDIPNPFDKLSLEELLYLRENNYHI